MASSGGLGVLGTGAALLVVGGLAFGQATLAIQGGASPDDPGLLSTSHGPAGVPSIRRQNRTPLTYGFQRLLGAAGMGLGLFALVGAIAAPRLFPTD